MAQMTLILRRSDLKEPLMWDELIEGLGLEFHVEQVTLEVKRVEP